MKLKSKLIATIVSMCAAIAVMGVGVWASSSQTFQITVKNDIDVKIISVDADVYGEFAVYSQFSGHTEADQTNPVASAYHHTNTDAGEAFKDRIHKDHGYLLYARGLNGYNDGKTGDTTYYDDETNWYHSNVQAATGSGYYNYVNEAKNDVYFATAKSEGVKNNDSTYDKPEGWAADKYNIDFNTHTAQITYMYTIRQWKMASANAATNEIEFALKSSISESTDKDIVDNGVDDSAVDLTTGLTNAAGTAGVYIDAYITRATDADNAANAPAAGTANGAGATESTLTWHRVNLNNASSLPESTVNETFYMVITYTFARTGANLDLSGLSNAVEHQLIMAPPGELGKVAADADIKIDDLTGSGDSMEYSVTQYDATANEKVKLCHATGLNTSQTGTVGGEYYGKGYQIYGEEFVPNFSPAQITDQLTQAQLNTCFANAFSATADEVNKPYYSNILGITADDTDAANALRPGYIFATKADGSAKNGDGKYVPDLTNGKTAYFVKTLNDGNTVPTFWNNDSTDPLN